MAKPHTDDLWQISDLIKKKFHAKTPNTTWNTFVLLDNAKSLPIHQAIMKNQIKK